MLIFFVRIVIPLILILLFVLYLFYIRRKRDQKPRERLEEYKLQHGYYSDPRNIKGNCPQCGSNNVEYTVSHRLTHQRFYGVGSRMEPEGGAGYTVPETVSVYTYKCKNCGNSWQITE
jgi:transcription elongation factor Elf1